MAVSLNIWAVSVSNILWIWELRIFHDSFMNFVNDEAAFEGCSETTMRLLQEVAYKDLYSYSVDDYNVMTVMEGCSILCTISDVTEENAEDMFREAVFEMRGISLDEDMEEE